MGALPKTCFVIVVAWSIVTCRQSQAQAAVGRPNMVVFFTADQGTPDANCNGTTDLHTPAIYALAKTGICALCMTNGRPRSPADDRHVVKKTGHTVAIA